MHIVPNIHEVYHTTHDKSPVLMKKILGIFSINI